MLTYSRYNIFLLKYSSIVKCYFSYSAKFTETCQINDLFYQTNKFIVKITINLYPTIELNFQKIGFKHKIQTYIDRVTVYQVFTIVLQTMHLIPRK